MLDPGSFVWDCSELSSSWSCSRSSPLSPLSSSSLKLSRLLTRSGSGLIIFLPSCGDWPHSSQSPSRHLLLSSTVKQFLIYFRFISDHVPTKSDGKYLRPGLRNSFDGGLFWVRWWYDGHSDESDMSRDDIHEIVSSKDLITLHQQVTYSHVTISGKNNSQDLLSN